MAEETYFSVDIEADGPLPGPNSMLSFGVAAFREDGTLASVYEANLDTLPGARPDPKTMAWWATQPQAWTACRRNLRPPSEVMPEFVKWVKSVSSIPVFVGYPATFDFLFMYTYMLLFAGESPFSFSALDIKSFAMAVLGKPYRQTTKRNMPKRWFGETRHTHVALDDAIEQGKLFLNILKESRNRSAPERSTGKG